MYLTKNKFKYKLYNLINFENPINKYLTPIYVI